MIEVIWHNLRCGSKKNLFWFYFIFFCYSYRVFLWRKGKLNKYTTCWDFVKDLFIKKGILENFRYSINGSSGNSDKRKKWLKSVIESWSSWGILHLVILADKVLNISLRLGGNDATGEVLIEVRLVMIKVLWRFYIQW